MLLAVMVLSGSVQAIERTAGNSTEVQMTWGALKDLIDSANQRITILDGKVSQIVKCNAKAKLYVPEADPKLKDADGCIVNQEIVNLQTDMKSVLDCAKTGLLYNAETKVCINAAVTAVQPADCKFESKTVSSKVCPAGFQMTGQTSRQQVTAHTSTRHEEKTVYTTTCARVSCNK